MMRTPVMARLVTVVAFAAVIGLSWIGPASASQTSRTSRTSRTSQGAWVRAAHLIPGLGTMSVTLTPFSGDADGSAGASAGGSVPEAATRDGMRTIAPEAGYGMVTGYQQIPVGFYAVAMRSSTAPAGTAPMITGTLKATAGAAFTVAGLGTKTDPQVVALSDDLTPPAAGRARVRLLPAADSVKSVTVTAENGPTVAQNAEFGRPTGYAAVPAGTWRLVASPDGAPQNAATTRVDLSGGSVYTLLVLDAGRGLKVRPVLDASGLDVMPAGGAQTGGGGMADRSWHGGHGGGHGSWTAHLGAWLIVLAAALMVARVRPARTRQVAAFAPPRTGRG